MILAFHPRSKRQSRLLHGPLGVSWNPGRYKANRFTFYLGLFSVYSLEEIILGLILNTYNLGRKEKHVIKKVIL